MKTIQELDLHKAYLPHIKSTTDRIGPILGKKSTQLTLLTRTSIGREEGIRASKIVIENQDINSIIYGEFNNQSTSILVQLKTKSWHHTDLNYCKQIATYVYSAIK